MEAACANRRCDHSNVMVHEKDAYFRYAGSVNAAGVGQICDMTRHLYVGGKDNPFVRFHLCGVCHAAVQMVAGK